MPGKTYLTKPKKMLYSVNEICKIIKVSRVTGVVELTLGELHVRFSEKAMPQKIKNFSSDKPTASETAPSDTPEFRKFLVSQQELEAELEAKEELESLMVSNPLEYERRLANGELEEDEGA
jgi:hypothetical protein